MLPTMGRIVHLWRFGAPPCCAIVTGIAGDGTFVNVVAFEVTGLTFELDVPFWPVEGEAPIVDEEHQAWWIWPPKVQP